MNAVGQRLRAEIEANGPLPFARFMEEALYGDGGYYTSPELPIGRRGDFVTGSSLSPLFGRATARLLARLDPLLGAPAAVLEVGCGDGTHLAAVAAAEPGLGRSLVGCDRVCRDLPAGIERVERLEDVEPLRGLVFSYELFDAQPVHRLVGTGRGEVRELHVGLDSAGAFAWEERELSDPELSELLGGEELARGQIADLAPGWRSLYGLLAERLECGLLVSCDYGFERRRLLDARVRPRGTLACYRDHRVHRDPFRDVGDQDLTAHVDFTALRAEGERRGLRTVALTRQAAWLTACGVFEDLGGADLETRIEAQTLLDGDGMGEEIRVLVQARGDVEAAVPGLAGGASVGGRRAAP